jgi:hypothetical protein
VKEGLEAPQPKTRRLYGAREFIDSKIKLLISVSIFAQKLFVHEAPNMSVAVGGAHSFGVGDRDRDAALLLGVGASRGALL